MRMPTREIVRVKSIAALWGIGLFAAYTASAAPTSGKVYQLVARHSGKCLDVTSHSAASGTQLQQWDCSAGMNQKFRAIDAGDGLLYLTAEESVLRVRVNKGETGNGAALIQSNDRSGDGAKLRFVEAADGAYQIQVASTNKCLDVNGVDTANGARVHQWECNSGANQLWTLREQAPLPIAVPNGLVFEKLDAPLDNPRFMDFSKAGDLLIGSGSGRIYRLKAPYHTAEVLVNFGANAHSVAFRQTDAGEELWVGETGGLYKTIYSSGRTYTKADFQKIASLPAGGGHSSRTVKLGPDNRIYVSLGISGNCSTQFLGENFPVNDRRGGILQLQENGTSVELVPYGTGLRNPVGFNWHPDTKVMYANNNGPDHWGFDNPREVFVEVHPGSFFGMPFYQVIDGKVQVDNCAPKDKAPYALNAVELPVATFPARNAPLDMLFVKKGLLKAEWEGSSLVALHGSWAVPASGDEAGKRPPKLVLVEFKDGKATGDVKDVLTGFQDSNGDRHSRPAGLIWGPDGALYLTSDAENSGLYRLRIPK